MGWMAPYLPVFDRVLDFAAGPRFAGELSAARNEYFSRSGEAVEEDRSFDARLQAFLDWYVFDRPLEPFGVTPVRAFAEETGAQGAEAAQLALLAHTVHGLFSLRRHRGGVAEVRDLIIGADYDVSLPEPLPGVDPTDVFEARLVPFEGSLHFSPAFLFHPRRMRRRIIREVRQRYRARESSVRDLLFALSRMAARAEHYRSVPLDAIYDFDHPPPTVTPVRLRCDPESVSARRGRVVLPLPIPPDFERA